MENENQIQVLRDRIVDLTEQIERAEEVQQEADAKASQLQAALDELAGIEAEKARRAESVAQLNTELAAAKQRLDEAESFHTQTAQDVQQATDLLAAAEREVGFKTGDIEAQEANADALQWQVNDLRDRLLTLKRARFELQEAQARSDTRQIDSLSATIRTLGANLAREQKRLADAAAAELELVKRSNALQHEQSKIERVGRLKGADLARAKEQKQNAEAILARTQNAVGVPA